MNKVRRAKIHNVAYQLEKLKEEIALLQSEEQDYYDNMPENLLSSMRADDSEEAISTMDDVIEMLEEISERLGDIA